MIQRLKKFSDSLLKNPSSQVFDKNRLMVSLQKKDFSKAAVGVKGLFKSDPDDYEGFLKSGHVNIEDSFISGLVAWRIIQKRPSVSKDFPKAAVGSAIFGKSFSKIKVLGSSGAAPPRSYPTQRLFRRIFEKRPSVPRFFENPSVKSRLAACSSLLACSLGVMFGVRSFECLECVSVKIRLLVPMNKGGWRPRVPAFADFSSGPSMDLLDFRCCT